VGGDVGAHLSAHLSAEVITYVSAEPNMDGHATCSARAPRDAQGGKQTFRKCDHCSRTG
jgi:hypothetical protein